MAGLESGPEGWGWVLDDIVKKTRENMKMLLGW